MKSLIVYGIPNCNTVKKALDWFKSNNIDVSFHNFKKEGITRKKLVGWSKKAGWESLLNKRGTTWRSVPADVQKKIITQSAAIDLMLENTSIIKRPVVEYGEMLFIGFDEEDYSLAFQSA